MTSQASGKDIKKRTFRQLRTKDDRVLFTKAMIRVLLHQQEQFGGSQSDEVRISVSKPNWRLVKNYLVTGDIHGDAPALTEEEVLAYQGKQHYFLSLYRLYKKIIDEMGVKPPAPEFALKDAMSGEQVEEGEQMLDTVRKKQTYWTLIGRESNCDLELLRKFEQGTITKEDIFIPRREAPKTNPLKKIRIRYGVLDDSPEPVHQPSQSYMRPTSQHPPPQQYDDALATKLASLAEALSKSFTIEELMPIFGPRAKFTHQELVMRLYHLIPLPEIMRAHIRDMIGGGDGEDEDGEDDSLVDREKDGEEDKEEEDDDSEAEVSTTRPPTKETMDDDDEESAFEPGSSDEE